MSFEPNPLFYIIVGSLIGMVIGWAMGFFDSNTRTAKKIEAAEANAETKIREAEQKARSSQTAQDDPGLLRLKKTDGRYTLELDGELAQSELSQDKRKRLIELITVFRLWLEGVQTSQAPVPTPPAAEPVREVAPRPVQPSIQPLTPAKKPEAEKNIASMSIVQQIDMVLQARLAGTSLDKRGIRLQESIQGGVEVYVGLQKFFAVDEVPDPEIKAAIRAAIAEWEKKYTPGM